MNTTLIIIAVGLGLVAYRYGPRLVTSLRRWRRYNELVRARAAKRTMKFITNSIDRPWPFQPEDRLYPANIRVGEPIQVMDLHTYMGTCTTSTAALQEARLRQELHRRGHR